MAGNPLSFWSLLLRSYGKETAYTALSTVGLAGKLAAFRNTPIPKLEIAEAEAILAALLDLAGTSRSEAALPPTPTVLTQEA